MSLSRLTTGTLAAEGAVSSTLTLTWPTSGITSSSFAVLTVNLYENGNDTVCNLPSGFTLRSTSGGDAFSGSGTTQSRSFVYTKECAGTESGDISITHTAGTSIYWCATLDVYNGSDDLTFASISAANLGAGSTDAIASSVSGTSGQGLICVFCLSDPPGTTNSGPSGMTQGSSQTGSTNSARNYYVDLVATGATGTKTWDFTSTRDSASYALLVNGASTAVTTDQEGARFGADDGSESAHTFLGTSDESPNVTQPLNQNLLLRALINATGDVASTAYTLRYQKNGSGGYVAVPTVVSSTDMSVVGAGAQSVSTTSGGSLAPAYPTAYTAVANDTCLLIAAGKHNVGSSSAPSDPTNYTQLGTRFREVGAYDLQITVWAKKLTASEAAPTLTVPAAYSGTSGGLSAQILILRGGDTSTLADATAVPSDSAAADQWTHTGITTATNGALVISAVVSADDNAIAILAGSEQGFTVQMSGASYDTTSGGDHAVAVATKVQASAGSVTMPTWDQTLVGTDAWAGLAIAIKPAVTTNGLYVAASSNIAAGGEATTARLAAPSGKATSDFVTGRRWDDENGTDTIDLTTDDYTEVEWCLQAQSPTVNGDYFDFRVYAGASALDTYGVTPRWTVGTPATPSSTPRGYRAQAFHLAALMSF